MNKETRRVMRLPISEQAIMDILRGRITVEQFDVPDDAQVVGVYHDFALMGWQIVLESAAFEPVRLGETIPMLPPFLIRRT